MKETSKQILAMPQSMTTKEVAAALGLTYNQVISVRKRSGVDYKKQNRACRVHLPEVYEMIEQGKTYKEIAEKVGMTQQGVSYHANKIGHSRLKQYNSESVKKQIADDYSKGVPLKLIAKKYNCDPSIPCRVAKEFGVTLRKKGGTPKQHKIIQLWTNGVKAAEISEMVGCALQTVYNTIKKAA